MSPLLRIPTGSDFVPGILEATSSSTGVRVGPGGHGGGAATAPNQARV